MLTRHKLFWYRVVILRPNNVRAEKSGSLRAMHETDALEDLIIKAVYEWERPLIKIQMFTCDEDGVQEEVLTGKQRINAILKTQAELNTGKFKHIEKRRLAAEALKEDKKPIEYEETDEVEEKKDVYEASWHSSVGTYESFSACTVYQAVPDQGEFP